MTACSYVFSCCFQSVFVCCHVCVISVKYIYCFCELKSSDSSAAWRLTTWRWSQLAKQLDFCFELLTFVSCTSCRWIARCTVLFPCVFAKINLTSFCFTKACVHWRQSMLRIGENGDRAERPARVPKAALGVGPKGDHPSVRISGATRESFENLSRNIRILVHYGSHQWSHTALREAYNCRCYCS